MTTRTLSPAAASTPLAIDTAPSGVAGEPTEPSDSRRVLDRLLAARPAYTTRFVAEHLHRARRQIEAGVGDPGWHFVTGPQVRPQAGDVVLARVAQIGQHKRLEAPISRRAALFVGDEILVAYGNRYAPDQFEALVPDDLSPTHLAAAGGLAGTVVAASAGMEEATALEPIALVATGERRLRLRDHAPLDAARPSERSALKRPPIIAVLGSSMNSGKTTTLAYLARGLAGSGMSVAAGKVTGTGAGGDALLFADAGAFRVLDFTHFGHASTYQLPGAAVRELFGAMLAELCAEPSGPDVVLVEVADGVYQSETHHLLHAPEFLQRIDGVVFAAADALGAAAGVRTVHEAGVLVAAVSGRLTAAPLSAREAAQAVPVPVLDTGSLLDPDVARSVLASIRR